MVTIDMKMSMMQTKMHNTIDLSYHQFLVCTAFKYNWLKFLGWLWKKKWLLEKKLRSDDENLK